MKLIEKNIFQTWYTDKLHPNMQAIIDRLRSINHEYTYKLFLDDDMDNFVNTEYEGEIADCYNMLNIIVAKADFWRYLVLYKYGGVYLDMDASINIPLNDLIQDDNQAIITVEGNPNQYVQWCLIFQKEHPILKKTIEVVVDNIKSNKYPRDIVNMTGPLAYAAGINKVHFDYFGRTLVWFEIKKFQTNITYKHDLVSYRIYGCDYDDKCSFKHNEINNLYNGRKYWRQDQAEKTVLKKK